jgi:hypothetical protein
MPWGLQFGQPKVKGVSQYLDELFTEAGHVALVVVMLGLRPKLVPWLLIEQTKEKALGIVGPYSTIEEALLTAVQLGEPYILILYGSIPRLEMANLVSKIYFERKKCSVLPMPAKSMDWVKDHERYTPTGSIAGQNITIFARKD